MLKYILFLFIYFKMTYSYVNTFCNILNSDEEKITIKVDLAVTAAEKRQGLMFKKELAENYGMIFVYDNPSNLTMWMKNTLVPLDIIFIDAENNIQYIYENASPLSETHIKIPSEEKSLAVLEVAGGFAKNKNIKPGDKVYWKQ